MLRRLAAGIELTSQANDRLDDRDPPCRIAQGSELRPGIVYDETMNKSKTGTPGPVHKAPTDLRMALSAEAKAQVAWKDLTPLARNEWICWVISAKQETTRSHRIQRAIEDLQAGRRRPCCWPGCPHRRPSAKKWFERRAS
jgi:Bacteriocin-protection, YdeI or OmpD-Associated